MASTSFIGYVTKITAEWLNEVNAVVHASPTSQAFTPSGWVDSGNITYIKFNGIVLYTINIHNDESAGTYIELITLPEGYRPTYTIAGHLVSGDSSFAADAIINYAITTGGVIRVERPAGVGLGGEFFKATGLFFAA